MASEIIVRYTPQFYNDITNKWVNVKYGKGAYPSKTWALRAVSDYGRIGCKHRLLVEKLKVIDVSYEEVHDGE